jgi:NAD(P) transhydrogenase subunit alpha
VKDGALNLNWDDEVVAKTCLTHGGAIKNEAARKAVEGA